MLRIDASAQARRKFFQPPNDCVAGQTVERCHVYLPPGERLPAHQRYSLLIHQYRVAHDPSGPGRLLIPFSVLMEALSMQT